MKPGRLRSCRQFGNTASKLHKSHARAVPRPAHQALAVPDHRAIGALPPPLEEAAATTRIRISSGIRMPPAEDDVFLSTTVGSIVGSTRPPAKALLAQTASDAARASFFTVLSSFACRKCRDMPGRDKATRRTIMRKRSRISIFCYRTAQMSSTCVPTLHRSYSSMMCSLYRPTQPFDDRRPILRVSWVPWIR